MSTSTHSNPGTTCPADQAYPAARQAEIPSQPASAASSSSTGEISRPAVADDVAPQSIARGLPMEVHAGSASQVKSRPPESAEGRPPAKDVHAGSGRPGGLPMNVYVK